MTYKYLYMLEMVAELAAATLVLRTDRSAVMYTCAPRMLLTSGEPDWKEVAFKGKEALVS
jgi:hypothetical protein